MIKFILPFPFVSGNHYKSYNRRFNRWFITKKGKLYRLAIKAAVEKAKFDIPELAQTIPFSCKVDIELQFFPPDRRTRDHDNFEKVFWDALTLAGVWDDDSLIGKKIIEDWAEPFKGGKVEVTLKPRKE